MTCYNPTACKHVSNCSSIPVSSCENQEHQLELLDTYFYSETQDQWCKGITCCEIVPCSTTEPPFPPAFPPLAQAALEGSDEWFHNNTWIVYIPLFFVTVFAVLLVFFYRRFRQNRILNGE
jgi:hypothetical protein